MRLGQLLLFAPILAANLVVNAKTIVKKSVVNVPCFDTSGFYRNPLRDVTTIWTTLECSLYYLCLEDEVFEFKCSEGLLFDVNRQTCEMNQNVNNCDLTEQRRIKKPLLERANCEEGFLGCADGHCIFTEYFCDGSIDCADGSDEGYCDENGDPNSATPCDPVTCVLPECFCSPDGKAIPGGLDVSKVPQMIILTFDDAINFENWDLYTKQIFSPQRRNPNNCPLKGTFFISHQYTNYMEVQKLWNEGHEIAVHSISHRGPAEWWSKNATIEEWFDEMVGQANILNRFANVRMEDIRGMRVPFLKAGWNRQFLMMKEFGFVYDSSLIAPLSTPPLWPYTLDHKLPHKCENTTQACPTRSYPGIWEVVLNQLMIKDYTCATMLSCPPNLSTEGVYDMLMSNFKRHYLTNRAPFGLHLETMWFKKTENLNALKKFLDETSKLSSVYYVTNHQAIEWMRHPTPLEELATFTPWQCRVQDFTESELSCSQPNTCKLSSKILHQDRYMITCNECPKSYPWIRNEFGIE